MKAVLWVRSSTVKQEIETMTNELYSFAERYGYSRSKCAVVGAQGASAIKADELYKEEIAKLYEELDTGKYNCLFAWELSRIGRKEEYVVALKNYLIDHRIQLRIMRPSLYLLEEDGSVNAGMELSLSLLTTLAKQEMKINKERMKRGKGRSQKEGRFTGGPCLRFGYAKDANGYIIEDPVTGQYVREMFDMYINQDMSMTAIYRNFAERGILRDYKSDATGANKILTILKSKTYAGFPDRGHIYPALVTEEMVDRCIEKASMAKSKPKTTTKNIYYCKGIIFCECGHRMVPVRNNCAYTCKRYGHSTAVSINVLDFIAWEITKLYKPYALKHRSQESLKEYETMSKSELSMMESLMTKKVLVNQKQERVNEMYIEGHITKQRYEEKLAEIEQEQRKLDKAVTDHLNRHLAAERLKNGILSDSFDIDGVSDDEMRRKYISETIEIHVKVTGDRKYRIYVVSKTPVPRKDWFDYEVRGNVIGIVHYSEVRGHVSSEIMKGWPVRFKRYR